MDKFFFEKEFTDYDQLAHEIRVWDLDFYQLDHGEFNAKLLQLKLGKGLLTNAQFNRSFEQRGSAPPGCWTFAILSELSSPLVWRDREFTKNSVVIYRPGTEIDAISNPGFDVYTLSYPENHLDELGQVLGLPRVGKLTKNNDVFYSTFSGLAEIRLLLRRMITQCREGASASAPSSLSNDLEYEIPKQILGILAGARHVSEKVSSRMRRQAIKRIKEFIATNPNELITIDHLCTIAQVSERTLQYAFKEHFGVTPKTYLNTLRINGARTQLWEADPATTKVNDVANSWGFWHMGQFAADYRKLFSELPSDTLRNVKFYG